MSSRALRRLQKEQLLIPKHDSDEEEEEVVVETTSRKQLNPFDLLNEGDDEEEEEEEEEQQEEYKLPEKPVHKESIPSAPKKGKEVEDISMRELEKVIKEMNKKSPGSASPHQNTHIDIYRQLLSVNTRFLDAEAEMKRLFGSHVVNSEHRGRVLKKSKFTTPKPEWPPYKRNGLSMEIVETVNGMTYFAFRHSEAYQDNQLEFLNA
ncbi:Transcription factor 25, partial [Rhizopus azygosporus]